MASLCARSDPAICGVASVIAGSCPGIDEAPRPSGSGRLDSSSHCRCGPVREDVVVVDGLPEKIGPWTVLEFLAQGGNGVVYKAVRPGDTVALKVLKARSGEPYERFTREIGFLREHQDVPGVLPLLDAYLPEVLCTGAKRAVESRPRLAGDAPCDTDRAGT